MLVIQATSQQLNPTLPQSVVDAAYADDPIAAAAEYGGTFRQDIEAFVPREVVEACTADGVFERPPQAGISFTGAVDMSGGSMDSSAMCISHRGPEGVGIVDAIREVKAPHSPTAVVQEFCATFKRYGVHRITGDRYGAEWVAEKFRENGVSYDAAEKHKSQVYTELLPLLNSQRVVLLDHERLQSQLCSLERRTGRGTGRDSIDHPAGPQWHDDVANAVALALVLTTAGRDFLEVWLALGGHTLESAGFKERKFVQ